MTEKVSAWIEKIIIPTYDIGSPEKNPVFLENRVYQGSRGAVYPYPVIEKIMDEKKGRMYTAVFIENDYLKIMILPELGGRIHRAFDKIRQRDFIYYNQVIKPALVGLTGPWISGGIEFNWPQHHRPTTFDPIEFTISENSDSSKTIWVSEIELMSRTKGMAGFTLYPDKAYIEVKGKIFNRSDFSQTFLWWANPAVKVNDHYRSVFPPDVNAVFDHGKRDVSDFPIATGTYYRVNYAPGTDISQYKNIPVPTSFMAVESKYDFIGCYENDTQAGMLHVADHHFSPGKKQWTWGTGDFGKAWDRNLTDEDGPYIELMCGVYTDNQPDFSWLRPNEEKTFEQYFMPYAGIGIVKNATKEAAINLEIEGQTIYIKVYATAKYPGAVIRLLLAGKIISESVYDLSPENIYITSVKCQEQQHDHDMVLEVSDNKGKLLVAYQPEISRENTLPKPAMPAQCPSEIDTTELLYLNGVHLEQYRHATFDPTDYYLEALRREPGDIRNNNAMGLWYLRRGKADLAEKYFRTALKTISIRNPNPYDGELHYNLGLCLQMLDHSQEAYDSFYKSTWNDAWQHNGFFQLSRLAASRKDFDLALYLVNKSLLRNYNSSGARHLKAALLRKLGKFAESKVFIESSLLIDPLNFGCHFEKYLIEMEEGDETLLPNQINNLRDLMRNAFNNYAEYALDYSRAGMFEEAISLLLEHKNHTSARDVNPLCCYYLGWLHIKIEDASAAHDFFEHAALANPDYCFPSKAEEVAILQTAIAHNPCDSKAYYYLGNYWYANGQSDEAIVNWEESVSIDDSFPTVYRNLSLAYYNKLHSPKKAIEALEKAFFLCPSDARVLMELDQLYKLQNYSGWDRLQLLENHLPLVEFRDDVYLERIILYNQFGDYETAVGLLAERKFHPWEGGEGKTVGQHLLCHTELAKQAIQEGLLDEALVYIHLAEQYPENLGEGKLPGTQENDIHYLRGVIYEKMGKEKDARDQFVLATKGNSQPAQAVFYNDPQPDKIFYQGLAWLKLGESGKANNIFKNLIDFGTAHLNDDIRIDYFAVSLPDLLVFEQDLNLRNRIHCNYMIALGYLGLGEYELSEKYLHELLQKDVNHMGAIVHLNMSCFLKSTINALS